MGFLKKYSPLLGFVHTSFSISFQPLFAEDVFGQPWVIVLPPVGSPSGLPIVQDCRTLRWKNLEWAILCAPVVAIMVPFSLNSLNVSHLLRLDI